MLLSTTSLPQFLISCCTNCWNSSGDLLTTTSMKTLDNCSFIAGLSMVFTTSAWMRLSTGFGMAAGANIPFHALVPTPGKPDSAVVGTFGNSGRRLSVVMASGLVLPEGVCGGGGA